MTYMVQNRKGEYYFQEDDDYIDDIIKGMMKIVSHKKGEKNGKSIND